MKLLWSIDDPFEADRICSLLEEKGIPIYRKASGAGLGVIGYLPNTQRYRKTLFVCIDSQLDDALTILRFPSHNPAEPVDSQQFHEDIEAAGYGPVLDVILGPALLIGLGCLVLIFVVYQLIVHS
jgi:hypothetical protein